MSPFHITGQRLCGLRSEVLHLLLLLLGEVHPILEPQRLHRHRNRIDQLLPSCWRCVESNLDSCRVSRDDQWNRRFCAFLGKTRSRWCLWLHRASHAAQQSRSSILHGARVCDCDLRLLRGTRHLIALRNCRRHSLLVRL